MSDRRSIEVLIACQQCKLTYAVFQTHAPSSGGLFACWRCDKQVLSWEGEYEFSEWRVWKPPENSIADLFEKLAGVEILLAKAKAELPPGEERQKTVRHLATTRLNLHALIEAERKKTGWTD
ncbi:MAG: hypothetical protein AB1582_11660 [Pseudomonadota bacterium]